MFANASLIALVGYSLFFVSDLFVKGAHTYGLNAVEIAFFISVFMSFFVVAQRKLDAGDADGAHQRRFASKKAAVRALAASALSARIMSIALRVVSKLWMRPMVFWISSSKS